MGTLDVRFRLLVVPTLVAGREVTFLGTVLVVIVGLLARFDNCSVNDDDAPTVSLAFGKGKDDEDDITSVEAGD